MRSFAGVPRVAPQPGMGAEIVYLGAVVPATVRVVDGPALTVVDAEGQDHVVELSELTAHFVLAGGPYFGPRLRLSA
jgi:hypothetical protein